MGHDAYRLSFGGLEPDHGSMLRDALTSSELEKRRRGRVGPLMLDLLDVAYHVHHFLPSPLHWIYLMRSFFLSGTNAQQEKNRPISQPPTAHPTFAFSTKKKSHESAALPETYFSYSRRRLCHLAGGAVPTLRCSLDSGLGGIVFLVCVGRPGCFVISSNQNCRTPCRQTTRAGQGKARQARPGPGPGH